ncbi:NACHT domain-containing protein [Frigoribacterium sp. PhB24]|uniref:NACHT domain-containing protein n=1 Tax=Frigoribacterium sp. PhB24 TaxID=2485204 RepID=UPI000F4A9EE7|nr:NACHT domain-containing protein [Frigoribacterium sp. PhB24]ROS54176.1 NACHT domain-containing protein [Frigoribacterium sp. PhB24]
MFRARERDGLFVNHEEIHAYEFTTLGQKDKAVKDGEKLAELLAAVGGLSDNTFKSRTGWFVTRDEPTADQRSAVMAIAKARSERIHAISIAVLHQRICNSEMYLQARGNAPFGSISYKSRLDSAPQNVPVQLVGPGAAGLLSLEAMTSRLQQGGRALLVGNYGVGKSHTLRELYGQLRKSHFKSGKLTPFPVHINLRDCAGLRTPAEILRRHAEEVGFEHADGLISAWRAGSCVLLLDGFDEVVPSRWLGGAVDLRTVRWEALSPIRRLVSETPPHAGIIVAGRSHYFSGQSEMVSALGFSALDQFSVPDFDEDQLREFFRQAGVEWSVPDWVPMRPLLLGYLIAIDASDAESVAGSVSRSEGWRLFIEAICEREAQMFSAVRPETIKNIVSRVATLARSRSDVTGPVDMDLLRSAFVAVNGRQPDEEGVQLLMRLPGLAVADPSDEAEVRQFVDRDLADTAYGLDLAAYAVDPFEELHPLGSVASWVAAASDLAIEVAAGVLLNLQLSVGTTLAALSAREKASQFDAVMADLIRLAVELPWDGRKLTKSYLVSGVYFEQLVLSDHPLFQVSTLQNCVVERLDLSGLDEGSSIPHFEKALVGFIDGVASLPDWLASHFASCEIDRFSVATQTTAGIMTLGIDRESRIALSILKKIFGQRGSARKEGALSRGLSLSDRPAVPAVVEELISQGWIFRTSSGHETLYAGVKGRRRDANRVLDSPADFKLQ